MQSLEEFSKVAHPVQEEKAETGTCAHVDWHSIVVIQLLEIVLLEEQAERT